MSDETGAQDADAPAEPELAPGEKRHYAHCPQCGTDFSAIGRKPLLLKCPGCGTKGALY